MAFARTLIDKLMTSFPDLKNLIMSQGQGNDQLNQGASSLLLGGSNSYRPTGQQQQQMMQQQLIAKKEAQEN